MTTPHDHDDPRYPVHKSDDEWRAQLDPMQYDVARHAATERAFSGRYWDHWDPGRYRCVGCGEVLFESGTKFDAGCGWPSYWAPAGAEVVERVEDRSHGMLRVEVRCKRCGCHLGHVFPDGPQPTGERFCINSAAIDFDAAGPGRDMTAPQRITREGIEARLREALAPAALEVLDDSHLHAGHAGAREGGHYTVRITSERFAGLARPARHRVVYDALGPLQAQGIHALAIVARAPGEG